MLHLIHALVARAALAVACTSALAAPAQLDPAPCVRAADAAPAAEVRPGPADLGQLAELERSAADLQGLRGGEYFTSSETILIVLGVVIIVLLIA